MGFATGFTGGATLTLSIAYLGLLAHRRTRETQSQAVRAQAVAIRGLLDPPPPPLPPRRSEVAAQQRDRLVEVAKDRWNAEVVGAVRWVQQTDWDAVREGMEERLAGLWRQGHGGETQRRVPRTRAGDERVAPAARTREADEEAELSVEDAALDARLRSRVVEEGRAVVGAAVEAAGKVVGLAEEQLEAMTGGNNSNNSNTNEAGEPSPVQRALRQRYAGTGVDTRTVQEVLRERYTPMDRRDNTLLRGL